MKRSVRYPTILKKYFLVNSILYFSKALKMEFILLFSINTQKRFYFKENFRISTKIEIGFNFHRSLLRPGNFMKCACGQNHLFCSVDFLSYLPTVKSRVLNIRKRVQVPAMRDYGQQITVLDDTCECCVYCTVGSVVSSFFFFHYIFYFLIS